MLIIIRGMKWINTDRKNFDWVISIICLSGLLWIILVNNVIEKIDVINEEIINKIIIVVGCQNIILVSISNSLKILMDGGAEMLIATKINHQKDKLGKIFIIPLIDKIFRVWNFK